MFSLFSSLRNLRLIRFFDTQTQKRNVPPGKPDGQLVKKSLRVFCQAASKLQNFFVVLFCNFAAAAGDQTRKDTLTVSFQLVEKSLRGFFDKLLPELQNQFLYHDFAILPLRRVIERERTP